MTQTLNSELRSLLDSIAGKKMSRAVEIIAASPELASGRWEDPAPDSPYCAGATPLHYAARHSCDALMPVLVEAHGDPNSSEAEGHRSVVSWAAFHANNSTLKLLLDLGADGDGLDAMLAAAAGGPERGHGREFEYAKTLQILLDAGADINDARNPARVTPLRMAMMSGNRGAIEFLRCHGAQA